MSFRLRASLAASVSAQTLSLESGGAAQLAASHAFPFEVIIRRTSDGAVEIGRALEAISSSALKIARAQYGTTALAFTTADSADFYPVKPALVIKSVVLGSPALGTATALNVAIPLTNAPQTNQVPTNQPDVARILSAKGNAGGIVGNVTFYGVDIAGNDISETIALSGSSEVFTTKAFAGEVTFDLPVETHAGTDTVSIGQGDALGIFDIITRDTIEAAYLGGVREGTRPTVAFDSSLADCTVLLSSALNGTSIIVDYYVD